MNKLFLEAKWKAQSWIILYKHFLSAAGLLPLFQYGSSLVSLGSAAERGWAFNTALIIGGFIICRRRIMTFC